MSIPGNSRQDSAALEEQYVSQSQAQSQLPPPFSAVQHDEAFNFLQEDNNPQALPSSISLAQLDFPVNPLAQAPAIWDDQFDDAFPFLNPQESSFLNIFDTKLQDNEPEQAPSGQPLVGRMISDVLIDGLHPTIINPGTTNATTTPSLGGATLSVAPRVQHSGTKDGLPVMQGNVSQVDLQRKVRPQTGKPPLAPSLEESWNLPGAAFSSQPMNCQAPKLSYGAQAQPSLLPISHESRVSAPAPPPRLLLNGASSSCNGPTLISGGVLQPTPRPAPEGNVNAEMRHMPNGAASFRRVLRRIARTNPGTHRVSVGEIDAHGASTVEERRGRKRKATEEEDEEELRKMRRVRNRESVEKCRAKQKQRLEKLEKEEKERRQECILMREVAESIQSKWAAIAAEYKRITGKEAGECPMSIPPDIVLPELTTMSGCDE
ncbi:hypothetical protein BWQ96_09002 [Gracilariopsis chorda]|uniref:BZIP domain-containing protein n=1 Tax=Gracilariopsis chorda TaxID=448386 RepID=A0A2V3IGR2_9FLOR|nr:hypothetical protein BWQ96_09002 [Gracilariopsis chorda]|eukprot:PXF41242.1 hypothetical protein BWQ96_09002 [Gracilariopsis chorda]